MILVGACAAPNRVLPPDSQSIPMGQNEIMNLISDTTVYVPIRDGRQLVVYFSADGTMRDRERGQKGVVSTDTGVWTVDQNGVFCVSWNIRNKGKGLCYFIYEKTDGYVYSNLNDVNFSYKIPWEGYRIGNTENL